MKSNTSAALLFSLTLLGAGSIFAQTTATTDPVGFNSVVCPQGADTYVSAGFNRPVEFAAGVLSLPSANQIQVSGSPGWANNLYAGTHFVKIASGTKAGAFFSITTNGSDTLTVDLSSGSLTGVVPTDAVQIIPYWTLSTLLPIGNTAITPSLGNSTIQRRTQVVFPNITSPGTNLLPAASYYQTAAGWFLAGDSLNTLQNNVQILPDSYFIIRNRTADPATTFTGLGAVDMKPITSELSTLAAGFQDNPIANNRPIDIKLKDLDLISSGAFVASAGTGTVARRDTIIVFSNLTTGFNKLPTHTYYFDSTAPGNWRDAQNASNLANDDVIPAGTGFIIRKRQSGDGSTKFWTHDLVNTP